MTDPSGLVVSTGSWTYVEYTERTMEAKKPSRHTVPHSDGVHHVSLRQKGQCVARIHWVCYSPSSFSTELTVGIILKVPVGLGEVFYLRLLLLHEPFDSFRSARSVGSQVFDTFQEAAFARGLISNDTEYVMNLKEAAAFKSPARNIICSISFFSFLLCRSPSLILHDGGGDRQNAGVPGVE